MPNLGVLNSVIQNLGWNDRIPELTAENFYSFGQALSTDEKNEFLGVLGKISEQFVYSANFNNEENLFAPFFKSDVPVGAFIERLYVGVIDPTVPTYNDNGSVSLSRVQPPIQASYYGFNYEVEYKQTISDSQSRSAFLSLSNMNQALNVILGVIPNSASLDLYNTTKELFSKAYALDAYYNVPLAPVTDQDSGNNLIETLKNLIFNFSRPNTIYNKDGVIARSYNDDIFVLVTPEVYNALSVKSLSAAFNMSELEIRDKFIVIDNNNPFGSIMNGTLALVVDRNFFNIHRQMSNTSSIYVPTGGGYFNYFMFLRYMFTFYGAYNGARVYDNTATYSITPTGVTTSANSATEGTTVNITAPESGNVYIVYTNGENDVVYKTIDVSSVKSFSMPANNIKITNVQPSDIPNVTDNTI